MTTYTYTATVTNVHDGDTITVRLLLTPAGRLHQLDHDLGFNVHRTPRGIELEGQAVRLLGCNAPELATPDGKTAQAALAAMLPIGSQVTISSVAWDKYGGRVDAIVTDTTGRDITQAMIAAGHAKAWDGTGPKPV